MVNKMILTSYLMGGLGNQMFQISKAICEGLKNEINVVFQKQSFTPMNGNQPTKYISNIFRNVHFVESLPFRNRITELSWSYNDIDVKYTNSTEFYGYYQSSKNFGVYSKLLKDIFSPTQEFIDKLKNIHPNIFNKDSVSIHVRRGDYLNISNVLPIIDKSYIDESLRQLGGYSNIFIFSDDKEWCKKNLKYNNSTVVENLEDYEELWSISLCNHNIMSNSSFSWWGSYLNKNENRKVFVPSIWFGPNGEKNYQDIYEKKWIKIKVNYSNGRLIC
jgi:hypothetical protein